MVESHAAPRAIAGLNKMVNRSVAHLMIFNDKPYHINCHIRDVILLLCLLHCQIATLFSHLSCHQCHRVTVAAVMSSVSSCDSN